jgi:hypothetical protein
MAVIKRRGYSVSCLLIALLLSTAALNYPVTTGYSATHSYTGRPGIRTLAIAQDSDPLSITPTLDTARAVTAVITTDGGTLTATVSNGAVFTLTIPKGALADQQSITMTPVSIPDLPLGGGVGLAAAVQLAPQGLILLNTATLLIQPASPVSLDAQSPFAWVKDGEDFHLFPLSLDLTTVTLNINHLDGYGIGSGSAADRQSIGAHPPSRLQARREQNVEIAVEAARNKLADNPTKKKRKKAIKALNHTLSDLFEADLDTILSELTPKTVNVQPRPQVFDGTSLLCGLTELLKLMEDQGELAVPLPSDVIAQANFAITTLRDQYFHDCEENVLSVGSLISLARIVNALARADSRLASLSSQVPDILDKANKCAKLTLVFNSHIDADFPYGTYTITMHADVPLTFDAKNNEFIGEAPMKHDGFAIRGKEGCGVATNSVDDTCRVFLKLGNLIATDCDSNTAYPKDYDLYIDIGIPEEIITIICPSLPIKTNQGPVWVGQFYCSHQADYYTGLFRIQQWTTGEGDVLASKEYEGAPCKENPFDEETTIELRRQ